MESRSLQYITEACGGVLRKGTPTDRVSRICTDSRRVQAGDLFFALAGDRFDGHAFLEDVVHQGAAGVVAEASKLPALLANCAVITVEATRPALGRLAARYRQDFALPVIAVGGSNGKTTTKELVASVLSQGFPTLRSEASFNNDIGVPLTLLGLKQPHRAAVLEVGTNHPGELAPLVRAIAPQYGILTSLGREHLEFFGNLEGVAKEEGWLAELLPSEGRLFIHGEGPAIETVRRRARASVIRIGQKPDDDWRITRAEVDGTGTSFEVMVPDPAFCGQYRLNLLGRHQAVNALFAIALGAELGLTREQIQRGLVDCAPLKMRLAIWHAGDLRVLDDAYNANADSTLAALATLCELPCSGRRVVVLGDMAELGKHSQAAHAEVGQRAAKAGIDCLFAIGQWASVTANAARRSGLAAVAEFPSIETASQPLLDYLQAGDLVLLKASRAARFERLGEVLRKARVQDQEQLRPCFTT